ncbi:MAG: tRNA (adenosine(37)-N6)-threonylcarbamoyltransferase complex ATPase subunit type 1 TsaE, partial [Clostridiales bacterium]|nr:tRNA (adenosine(37)-N6)-threonylcarbamoyltransferase complex ATPase subunit type 1 TsaE [Clostridiales bacterium]
MMLSSFLSKSREDTLAFAEQYALTLVPGDVVLLDGD